ncbi:AMIN-like domain-containing (lipo)protein [Cellulomonas composti]
MILVGALLVAPATGAAATGTTTAGATAIGTTATGATAAAAPYCGITWGSQPRTVAGMSTAQVAGVRTGRHSCFDRLVIDVNGDAGGYTVRYVKHVRHDASGKIIPTKGGAALQLTVNDPGDTYRPAHPTNLSDVTGYRTFRQVVFAGAFEGYTSFGLGVRARLPFRVFVLDGPGTGSRVVVDVAHQW